MRCAQHSAANKLEVASATHKYDLWVQLVMMMNMEQLSEGNHRRQDQGLVMHCNTER